MEGGGKKQIVGMMMVLMVLFVRIDALPCCQGGITTCCKAPTLLPPTAAMAPMASEKNTIAMAPMASEKNTIAMAPMASDKNTIAMAPMASDKKLLSQKAHSYINN